VRSVSYPGVLQINLELAEGEPDNTGYRQNLAFSYQRLGDLARAEGRSREAKESYERALQINLELAEGEPDNTVYRQNLAASYEQMADSEYEPTTARRYIEQALAIRRNLHQRDIAREDLAVELTETIILNDRARNDPSAGAEARSEIVEVLTPFAASGSLGQRGRAMLDQATAAEDRDERA
jgi:tetratricopeptide (TPR) repeat protein